jgi:small subunit ribosomal protein S17
MNTTSLKGKVLTGTVVKAAMKDTVVVSVMRYVKHPKYQKYLRRSKKYLVHDEGNKTKVGDKVEIRETRPISKHKHFMVASVITPAASEE